MGATTLNVALTVVVPPPEVKKDADPKLPVPPKAPQLDLPDAPKDKKGASLNFPNRREFSAPVLRAEAVFAIRDRA